MNHRAPTDPSFNPYLLPWTCLRFAHPVGKKIPVASEDRGSRRPQQFSVLQSFLQHFASIAWLLADEREGNAPNTHLGGYMFVWIRKLLLNLLKEGIHALSHYTLLENRFSSTMLAHPNRGTSFVLSRFLS